MRPLLTTLIFCACAALYSAQPALAAEKKSPVGTTKASKATKANSKAGNKTQTARKNTGKPQAKKSPAPKNKAVAAKSSAKPQKASLALEPWQGNPQTLHSGSVLVLDQQTGHTLLEKRASAVQPIASISKLMTAMVVMDAGLDLNETIQISDEDVDYQKNTRSRLQVGSSMSRDTALLLALMSSENRAAHALGRHYPGGIKAFVSAMNQKALDLGMKHTRFEEPTGLSSNNVSTAHDLAIMVTAAHQYPKIREYSTTAQAEVDMGTHVTTFNNTNALVKSPDWQIGLSKTGYISEAGRCLVMQAWVAQKPVVIVLLDSNGKMTRVGDANRIKNWMESPSSPVRHING